MVSPVLAIFLNFEYFQVVLTWSFFVKIDMALLAYYHAVAKLPPATATPAFLTGKVSRRTNPVFF